VNYRHDFHAGNFADVHKHAVLARILEYLKRKDAAFRVIDTHAGSGLYDLRSDEALRTGEWVDGIARLQKAAISAEVSSLLAVYNSAVEAQNTPGRLDFYPGSPLVTRHLLRRQDRMTLVELHPKVAAALKSRLAGDQQVKVIELDGWLALGAQLPPKEKRGLVLVDPPFEAPGEFDRLIGGLEKAIRRWPGGIYALWYPIKDHAAVAAFRAAVKSSGIPKIMDVWLEVDRRATPGLTGSGMIVVNPPFVLEAELQTLMPALAKHLGRTSALWGVDWLTREAGSA
jgi:23S rRNA (adenine2030-N6)-methyltransferase